MGPIISHLINYTPSESIKFGLYNLAEHLLSKFLPNDVKYIDIHSLVTNNHDIYHSPFYPIPNYINLSRLKVFQTIYDLIPIMHPEFFAFNENHLILKIVNELNRDTFVICISESTKNDLCNLSKKLDINKIFVIPLAASEKFYQCTDNSKITLIRNRYGIPPDIKYLLSISTLEPRKNIEQTIKAFIEILKQKNIHDLYLVLTGTKGWNYERIFATIENSKEFKEKIILTGYVPDDELAPLYSGALAFVYPSFYEGFGLPPLEAMQCGTPVITSNTSSLPEVVDNAGIMVDPIDLDALCQALLDVYTKQDLRESMSRRSLARAKLFSWEKHTQGVISAYKAALLQKSP